MPNYNLSSLGPQEFERMVQSLLKEVIGNGTITFGAGPDGGREATFQGRAPYPSEEEQWDGCWIFQAKFHDIEQIGLDSARKQVLQDLSGELEKIISKYSHPCDNYILATNVPLSGVAGRGTHDRIAKEVAPRFTAHIRNIRVWGADELYRMLDKYPNVRFSYMQFLSTGDLIRELLANVTKERDALGEAMKLYLSATFRDDLYAQLLQAGDAGEVKVELQHVFIDLDVRVKEMRWLNQLAVESALADARFNLRNREVTLPGLTFLLADFKGAVLIGGPGQGKSTMSQYLAQIHRATLLRKSSFLGPGQILTPVTARIPFRIQLKEFAQWLSDPSHRDSVEAFLADRVTQRTSRDLKPSDIHQILKTNPTLLIFDGLDEVMDVELQAKMMERIDEFLARCGDVLEADIQVLATSRPIGYSNQFDSKHFAHLELSRLSKSRAEEYVAKWADANQLDPERRAFLEGTLADYFDDKHLALLMNTPLQITILMLIILSGGAPPRQREALFNEYLEVIYRREKAKARWLITTDRDVLFGLHQFLGYLILSRAERERGARDVLTEDEFRGAIREYLQHNDDTLHGKPLEKQVSTIVTEARVRFVLIVEPTPGTFGFELRSILEFFAAGHLCDTSIDSAQRLERFKAIAPQKYWRNVALFFAGRLARQNRGEAPLLLLACKEIDTKEPDRYLRRGTELALALAEDRTFGAQRNLQRDALALVLSLVQPDAHSGRRHAIRDGLSLLPSDDVRDFVGPELANRLSAFDCSHLDPVIQLYAGVIGLDDEVLIALDRCLSSNRTAVIRWALNWCSRLDVERFWLQLRVTYALEKLDPGESSEVIGKFMDRRPTTALEIFGNDAVDESILSDALSTALLRRIRRAREFSDSDMIELGSYDLLNRSSQIWVALRLHEIIERLNLKSYRRSIGYGDRVRLLHLPTFSVDSQVWVRQEITAVLQPGELEELVSASDTLPQLRGCGWLLLVFMDRDNEATIAEFNSFLVEAKSQFPSVLQQLYRDVRRIDGPLAALIRSVEEGSTESPFTSRDIADLSELEDQVEVDIAQFLSETRRVEKTFRDRIAWNYWSSELGLPSGRVDSASQNLSKLVGNIGSRVQQLYRFREATGSENEFHGELFMMLDLKTPSLSQLQVSRTLDGLESLEFSVASTATVMRRLQTLFASRWTLTSDASRRLLKVLSRLHSVVDAGSTKYGTIEREFYYRLLLQSGMDREVILNALSDLGHRVDKVQWGQPGFRIFGQVEKILRMLSDYLFVPIETVRKGAIFIVDHLLVSVEQVGDAGSEQLGSFWSTEVPRELVCLKSTERMRGIRMLACSRISVSKDLPWILEEIQKSDSFEESQAWAFFINSVKISASKAAGPKWAAALATLIDGNHPLLIESTFRRYQELVEATTPSLSRHEIELGLPLQ